jgi:hypothetical protein
MQVGRDSPSSSEGTGGMKRKEGQRQCSCRLAHRKQSVIVVLKRHAGCAGRVGGQPNHGGVLAGASTIFSVRLW